MSRAREIVGRIWGSGEVYRQSREEAWTARRGSRKVGSWVRREEFQTGRRKWVHFTVLLHDHFFQFNLESKAFVEHKNFSFSF